MSAKVGANEVVPHFLKMFGQFPSSRDSAVTKIRVKQLLLMVHETSARHIEGRYEWVTLKPSRACFGAQKYV